MGMLRLREETRFARDHACVSWDLSSGSSIAESSAHGCAMGVILCVLSRVPLFATPLVHQAPPSMEFPRQEYWSGLPLPPLGDLPDSGIKSHLLCLLHWQAGSLPRVPPEKPLYKATPNEITRLFSSFCPRLKRCRVSSSVCGYLTTTLIANKHLLRMDLSGNDLGLPGMQLLCQGLRHPKCRLQVVQ